MSQVVAAHELVTREVGSQSVNPRMKYYMLTMFTECMSNCGVKCYYRYLDRYHDRDVIGEVIDEVIGEGLLAGEVDYVVAECLSSRRTTRTSSA